MNLLILGDGLEELAWARALDGDLEDRVVLACPGFKGHPGIPSTLDLDEALAKRGVDAVLVGGDAQLRPEGLRRAAAEGLSIIALHPPGPNADPYYQIALSGRETGAIVVPDLPGRLHPGLATLEKAIRTGEFGDWRGLRYEISVAHTDGDLLGVWFPRVVDPVRALIGEIEAVTATGDPPGDRPTQSLVAQLRGSGGRRAEIHLSVSPPEPARLTLQGSEGLLSLEHDLAFLGPSSLKRRSHETAKPTYPSPLGIPKRPSFNA